MESSKAGSLATRFDFASQAGSYALIRQQRRLLDERIECRKSRRSALSAGGCR